MTDFDGAHPEDTRLIEAAIASDPDALRLVWERHRRWAAALILAYKPREADLEDLLQEVAMSFVRRVHELRDPAAFKPWLRSVAINAARLSGRKQTLAKKHGRHLKLLVEQEGLQASRSAVTEVAPTTPESPVSSGLRKPADGYLPRFRRHSALQNSIASHSEDGRATRRDNLTHRART